MRTRAEWLAFTRRRALAELDRVADPLQAMVTAAGSVAADLRKHPRTANHPDIIGLTADIAFGQITDPAQLRARIEALA